MCAVMDEFGLADLATTIAGLTVIGAAAILAETGDPARFATPRALVKDAGLSRDNASGAARAPPSPAAVGPACGWPPGGPSGRRCPTTR